MVDAVVLAGRRNQKELRTVSDVEWEALVPIAGRPMASWVIDALRASKLCKRIVVVGPSELWEGAGADGSVVAPSDDLIENVRRGAHALSGERPILVCTSDIPMLTPEAVQAFLAAAADIPAEFHYPVIPHEDVERQFPGNKRTYVRLRDGTFTGGNFVLLDPKAAKRAIEVAQELVALRKKPLRLGLLVGLGFVVRLVLGQATVGEAERRFSRLLGVQGRAVRLSYPEVGVDVDHPGDVPYCEQEIRRRQGRAG
ncbi:MAG: NTP transferase domain-containing protein [Thermaerobacter sp.]|nr:NTP transferase domain-containing protein [Thermaerobacter sp.]